MTDVFNIISLFSYSSYIFSFFLLLSYYTIHLNRDRKIEREREKLRTISIEYTVKKR